jgi:hypothetical protein
VSLTGQGIYRSTTNGASWSESSTSVTIPINQFLIANNGIYAASLGEGILFSSDDGQTWSPVDSGLGSLTVYSLALDANGFLWAGTLDGGIYRSTISTSGVRAVDNLDIAVCVYPNPTSGATTLSLSGADRGELEISDILGNIVYRSQFDSFHIWDGKADNDSRLPPGSYIARVRSRDPAKPFIASTVFMIQ